MNPVPQQLSDYIKSLAPAQVASGTLQRLPWKNRNGSLAVPRSVVRRLEELAEDGTLSVEIKDRHAWYSWANKKSKVSTFEPVWNDGRIVARREVITYV